MKTLTRSICLLIILSMCLVFAACSSNESVAGAPAAPEIPAETSAPAPPSPTPAAPTAEPTEEPVESVEPQEPIEPEESEAPEASSEPSPEVSAQPSPAPESTPIPSPVPTPEAPAVPAVDLTEFYSNITGTFEFAMMISMDSEMLDAFYPGLTAYSMKQSICMMPMITGVACEVLLVECENEDDSAAVEAIFEARKQSQADGGAFYPETVEAWSRAYVVRNGCFVALFAHTENSGDMAAMFDRLFA